jgi:hypothetical protein
MHRPALRMAEAVLGLASMLRQFIFSPTSSVLLRSTRGSLFGQNKYRTPSPTAEQLSAPGLIQKVRTTARIGAGPVIPRTDYCNGSGPILTIPAADKDLPRDRSQRGRFVEVILKICEVGNPVLRKIARSLSADEIGSKEIQDLIGYMRYHAGCSRGWAWPRHRLENRFKSL